MKSRLIASVLVLLAAISQVHAQWQPKKAPLMTRWAKDVSPDNAHREYPRPQMERPEWVNLNGLWDYAITSKETAAAPEKYDGKILVPFPIESALSGVMKSVGAKNRLWYQRNFTLPQTWKGQRIILHFGAVDWESQVWINGKEVGKHTGGYDPFSLDVTDAIKDGANTISITAWDPTTDGFQPIGKQHARPSGIWYTPTSGIWQTVWIEPVPQAYIKSLKITPDVDKGEVEVIVDAVGINNLRIDLKDGGNDLAMALGTRPGEKNRLKIPNAKLWTPDSPHLYSLRIVDAAGTDKVDSYFAMRKISLGKDKDGITRIMLNNQPVFQHGPLDQGFWPDGLYTAPTDEALRSDIEMTKKLGFNMARKHVKVEPDRWYYWCDKLGLLVWQDMPSGDKHVAPNRGEITRTKESAENYERELKAMMTALHNHPSIIIWVPFNEGWGQFDTVRITNQVKQLDPSRLAICASGWNDFPAGDAHDIHVYPGPGAPKPEENRAAVLGEYGGLGLPIAGHLWLDRGNWGYRTFKDKESLTSAYESLIHQLRPLIGSGLSAAVYTQTTDVEIEVNGLMTYDREMVKPDLERVMAAHRKLLLPPPKLLTIVPTSRETAIVWKYTTAKPADDWMKSAFRDGEWKSGPAGFGTEGTPGAIVRTEWNSPDIWLRRTFELGDAKLADPHLLVHHDEDAEIYINGELVATATGFTTEYVTLPLNAKGRSALKAGQNIISIHCKQTGGGQYIDAGIVDLVEAGPAK
jgi:hypothetical protein